jgi:hypothetical protein
MASVVIPALCSVEILLKIKGQVKSDNGQLWDITLAAMGIFGFLYGSMMSFLHARMKASLMHLALAGIGVCLFLLTIDQEPLSKTALAALSVSTVGTIVLISLGSQMGRRHQVFTKMSYLGLPGMAAFTALFFAVRMTITLNILWLGVFVLGYFFQFATLIGYEFDTRLNSDGRVKVRFWLLVLAQLSAGLGLLWMGGVK